MYLEWRLWEMMAGFRLRVAAAVGLGLVAMAVGILRFVCLGRVLALTFAGAPFVDITAAAAASIATNTTVLADRCGSIQNGSVGICRSNTLST